MKITRAEAETLAKQYGGAARHLQPAAPPDLLRQAVIATEYVTGLPEWDVFLQRIQVFINDERALISAMTDSMPATMTSEQVLQAHRKICESRAKVEAWERVLALPKMLLSTQEGTPQAA